MSGPTFLKGTGIGLGLSLAGAALFAMFATIVGPGVAMRGLVALLAFAYVLWLLGSSKERAGRLVVVVLWLCAAAANLVMTPPFLLYVLIHAGLIWLIRSLYFYSGIVPAAMDMGLSLLAVSAAVWAATWSGSVFLAIWCFFLVQALFVAIPTDLTSHERASVAHPPHNDGFQRAHRAAEAALKRLATSR